MQKRRCDKLTGRNGIIVFFVSMALILSLSGCSSFAKLQDDQQLMISLDGGSEKTEVDTHGGMGGDGYSLTIYSFDDDSVLNQIRTNKAWETLPMDDVTEKLAYGKEITGPYLCDDDQNPILPKVKNGYYILIDRRNAGEQKEHNILDGLSFNFTIGIYDSDLNKLYVGKLDT